MNNTHYLDWDGLVTYDIEIKLKIRETKEDIESRIPTKVTDLLDGANYINNSMLNATKLDIISRIPTRVSQLTDESNYVTKNYLNNTLETTSNTIYNNVRNEIPKNVSDLNDKDNYVTHTFLENSYDTSIKNFINTTKEEIESSNNNKYYTQTEVDSKLQQIELTPGPRGASTLYYNGNISESAQSPLIPISGKVGDIIISKNGIIAEVTASHSSQGCTVTVKGSIKGPKGETGVVDYSVLENYTLKEEFDTTKYDLNNRITNTQNTINNYVNDLNSRIDEVSGTVGPQGEQGKSAYEIAIENGFEGTQEEWLISLKGEQGSQGKSAYQVATDNGYEGTEQQWLASLKGPKGDTGVVDTTNFYNKSEIDTKIAEAITGGEIDLSGYATKDYVDNSISNLVGDAPEALDTLKEIADKLGDNDNAVSSVISAISAEETRAKAAELANANITSALITTVNNNKTAIEGSLTNEVSRAQGIEQNLQNQINAIVVPTNISDFVNDANYVTTDLIGDFGDYSIKTYIDEIFGGSITYGTGDSLDSDKLIDNLFI